MEETTPDSNSEQKDFSRELVNPIAVNNCVLKIGDWTARVLDLSFVRLVVAGENCPLAPGETGEAELLLDRSHLRTLVRLQNGGDGWLRLSFEKLVPSVRAFLRAFLSPKKVGESIWEDWRTDSVRHFHGLNDSELWFNQTGTIVFTYLDQTNSEYQFVLRVLEGQAGLVAGKILREDYFTLPSIEGNLPLAHLGDRETVVRLGECRDILTNFRPVGQVEYNLKQRLLRLISDYLYSTSHKVDMIPVRPVRQMASPTPPPTEV